ncbi:MAG TPA: hypothetical protein VMZ29_16240 [Candidatus Bathyarchaeia archaeon]|nr:hypothetical protein [Candidatus Bathyarchaeia archaeon]
MIEKRVRKKLIIIIVLFLSLNLNAYISSRFFDSISSQVISDETHMEINNPIGQRYSYYDFHRDEDFLYCLDYNSIDMYNYSEPSNTKLVSEVSYPVPAYNDYYNNTKYLLKKDEYFIFLNYNSNPDNYENNLPLDFTFYFYQIENYQLKHVASKIFYFEFCYSLHISFIFDKNYLYLMACDTIRNSTTSELVDRVFLNVFDFSITINPTLISSYLIDLYDNLVIFYKPNIIKNALFYIIYLDAMNPHFFLNILNISDSTNIEKINCYDLGKLYSDTAIIIGDIFILYNGTSKLTCFDFTDIQNPYTFYVNVTDYHYCYSVIIQNNILYSLTGSSLYGTIYIYNIVNFTNWQLLSKFQADNLGQGTYLKGEIFGDLLITIKSSEYQNERLFIFNCSNPSNLVLLFSNASNSTIDFTLFNTIMIIIPTLGISVILIKRKSKNMI